MRLEDLRQHVSRATLRSASVSKPLYGHTSVATAYQVDDYPYGFRLRTKIRYWLEYKPNKGWRFVSQTANPKIVDREVWNKPKASTYTDWAAAMYLDEKGHVTWTGLGRYSDVKEFAEFVTHFPQADFALLKKVVPAKIKYLDDMVSGRRVWTVNGVPKPPSEAEIGDYRKERGDWVDIAERLHVPVPKAPEILPVEPTTASTSARRRPSMNLEQMKRRIAGDWGKATQLLRNLPANAIVPIDSGANKGKFVFRGRVDLRLYYIQNNGKLITPEQAAELGEKLGMGVDRQVAQRLGVKIRIFDTREDAVAAAKKIGVTVSNEKEASTRRADTLKDLETILKKYGYDPKDAKKLLDEGMGELELEERAKIRGTGVGTLVYTHGLKRVKASASTRREALGGGGRSYPRDPVWIKAKYPGVDSDGKPFKKGDRVLYWPNSKTFMQGPKAEQAWREFQAQIADEIQYNS